MTGEMLSVITSAALAVIVFAALWWVLGIPLALAYGAMRTRLGAAPPRVRLRVLSLISVLPVLLAAAIATLLFLPAAGDVLISQHCHEGIGCHGHAPVIDSDVLAGALLGLALFILAAAALRAIRLVYRHRSRHEQLRLLAVPSQDGRYWLIDTDQPFALTAGLWQQDIFISNGLVERLETSHLHSVIAHEQAHAVHRDNLRLAIAGCAAPTLLASGWAPVLRDLRRALEERADATAAACVADRLLVADALINSRRASRAADAAPAHHCDGAPHLSQRIARLVEEPLATAALHPAVIVSLSAIVALTGLFGVNAVHHGAEMLLALFER